MKAFKIIKQILAILGILLVIFEIYYHGYEKPRVDKLINDAKLLSLFMVTQDFEQDNEDENKNLYGEVS